MNDLRNFLDRLSAAKRVLITTHVRPDGDALGTAAAMAMALHEKQIAAEVLLLSHLPTKYAFIFSGHDIVHHDVERGWPAENLLNKFDTLLVVDTGTWSQLPGLRDQLANWHGTKLVMDHHLTQEDWADVKYVRTDAAAAGEIAAEVLQEWKVPMTPAIAEVIFVAIASDTGWFHFANTRPNTLRLAATLIEAGAETDKLYQLLFQNERAQRVALQTRAQQSLELLANNRLAVMTVSQQDFAETHAAVPDTENLINIPLQIRMVEVSLLLVEPADGGQIRVSLRSKGGVDVAKFAEQFGGGGHARASGLKIEGSLQQAHDRVVKAMIQQLENMPGNAAAESKRAAPDPATRAEKARA